MESVRAPSVAEAIARHIERLILQGALRSGEKLTAERELAESLGVSRPSLRDALGLLVTRGLLTTTRSGTFVAEFLTPITKPLASLLENSADAVHDYFEFRQSVDQLAARYAATRANDVDREAIKKCIATMKAVHAHDDPAQEAQADLDLHLLIYDASHNIVLLHVMRALAELLRSNIFYSRKQLYACSEVRNALLGQHVKIAEAILAGQPDAAEQAAAAHLAFTRERVAEIGAERSRLAVSQARATRSEYVAAPARRKKKST
jgi:GntR family transcriptional repressor for pyruvate dehydrogenase complex